MRYVLLFLALLLTACAAPSAPTQTVPDVSGHYEHFVEDVGCAANVQKLSEVRIEIELLCNAGAPAYNSGYLYEELLFADDKAMWSSPYGACELMFMFSDQTLLIHQEGFECGFGAGVVAQGEYPRTSDLVPMAMGCMRPDIVCEPLP